MRRNSYPSIDGYRGQRVRHASPSTATGFTIVRTRSCSPTSHFVNIPGVNGTTRGGYIAGRGYDPARAEEEKTTTLPAA